MKTLHTPEQCLVLLEHGVIRTVRWNTRTYSVLEVLDAWVWCGDWWRSPDLLGERRAYWRLACKHAILEVFERLTPLDDLGFFVAGWED
jgi:hypothetical protein